MNPQDLADKLKTKKEKAKTEVQNKLMKDAVNLVNELRDILESNKDGVDKVVRYLDEANDSMEVNNNSLSEIIKNELRKVVKGINNIKIPKQKYLSQVQMKNALTEALTDVKNILIKNAREERPQRTDISYNKDTQPIRIEEQFTNYKIITRLSYNRGLLTTITDELE